MYKDENRHERHHPGPREETGIRPQYSGHGTARPYHWNRRIDGYQKLHGSGAESTNQVKNDKAKMPEDIFDVITEDPKKPHIAYDV